MNVRPLLAASALIVVGALSLSGCSAFDSIVHKQSTSTFDDAAAFAKGAGVDADWIPADSSQITVRTSTVEKAEDAVILLTSASDLADACTEVERQSAPSWTLDGAPDPYKAKTVFVCGDWAVMATDGGWYGWAPNSDGERAAAG